MNELLFYFRVVNTLFPSCQFNLFLSNPCLQNKSAQIFNKPLALDAQRKQAELTNRRLK